MNPIHLTLAAAGRSPWIPINRLQSQFKIGLSVTLSADGNLTYSVQHTFDDVAQPLHDVVIARAGTVATVTDKGLDGLGHKMRIGDSVTVYNSGDANLNGEQVIASVVDANNYTYTVANTGLTASLTNTKVQLFQVFTHPTMAALTADSDGNYDFPCQAVRFIVSPYTAGSARLTILQGMGRE